MRNLTSKIKEKAFELGFNKVGITKAEFTEKEKQNLDKWLSKNYHASMDWIEKRKEERGNIFKYFPEAVSLVALAMMKTRFGLRGRVCMVIHGMLKAMKYLNQ